jgi:pSer/pThr/pTyr-binding forkhead associated (FHA) protein
VGISACHCTFELREGSDESGAAVVVVTDSSTNGTYINHGPIGKGKAKNLLVRILHV